MKKKIKDANLRATIRRMYLDADVQGKRAMLAAGLVVCRGWKYYVA